MLKFFPHLEGYVEFKNNQYLYTYQYKDHLGNIRLTYRDGYRNHPTLEYLKDGVIQVTEIIEENNYYPFGLKHKGYNEYADYSATNKYKYAYGGKELNNELGLDLYDFGARNYDAAIGRWLNVDPLAENSRRWTPYNYAYNNPIYFVDPDGMQSTVSNAVNNAVKENLTFNNGYYDINISEFGGAADHSGFYPNSEYKANQVTSSGGNTINNNSSNNQNSKKSSSNSEIDKVRAKDIWKTETSQQDNNYNFFYKEADSDLRTGAEYFNDGGATSTTIAINSHGNKNIISTPNGSMKPKALHKYLYNNNVLYKQAYDNKTIINININACKTGNGFAKELSKINPYINVKAPTNNLLGIWNKMKDDGKWVIYNNGKLIK